MVDEEYEVIPTSPIRRLEKRISKIESTTASSGLQKLIEQIIELIKSNQRVIDDVIKANSELRNELSKIPGKLDQLISNINEFIEILKASAAEEATPQAGVDMKPLVEKITELVEQTKKNMEINQAALTNLSAIDTRMKRLQTQLSGTTNRRY